jgi:phosphoribosylamine-glycine ligase
MNAFKKIAKPTGIFLALVLLLVSTSHQSGSAAMVGTEKLLTVGSKTETRAYLHQLTAREETQRALMAQGVDPQEAHLRIESLTDEEIALIADKIDSLAAGKGVFIFSMIIVAVIVAAFIVFNYTRVTDVFP